MARFTETELEELKQKVDLAALVRTRGVELKAAGTGSLMGLCPFHDDDKPSFGVTPGKGLWHCLGCGAAGNAIQFVMKKDGISFRNAVELLRGQAAVYAPGPLKTPKLAVPLSFDADDRTLLQEVATYYHEHLRQSPHALAYLQKRGLTAAAVEHFKLGFADRTLGLRLPNAETRQGGEIRTRLKKLGVLRAESGHEHLNGCVTFPLLDESNAVVGFYGRKIYHNLRPGTSYHLYLPGPHRGFFNHAALATREIILCEAVIDALTFWCAGLRHATCIYGTEAFTDELWGALLAAKIKRVYLAYDRDKAGDRAAARDAERLIGHGIECFRVKFPPGMDANEYARKVTPPDKSLRVLMQGAEWLGQGRGPVRPFHPVPPDLHAHAGAPSSIVAVVAKEAAAPETPAVPAEASAPAAAPLPAESAKVENDIPSPETPPLETHGEDRLLTLGDRQWRVRGLDKNNSFEVLRVNLRLWRNGLYYVNVIDLYQAKARAVFIEEAARETVLEPELIKRDLGKLLLQLEAWQEERVRSVLTPAVPVPVMDDQERADALALLRDPHLLDRILADFETCGIIGEEINKLAGYLAAVSRKLDRPLAVIVQSTSAAGKSSLMDAVLGFVPPEEKIKYSAMTGQSLYYLGESDLKHKVLAIVEEEGAEKASYALKLLQSEGELTIASTSKDERGRMRTEEYRVEGPVMIFLTTTAVDVDEELLNRCLVLTVDESRAQTEAIHRGQREAETLAGLEKKLARERVWKLHRNAQRLLQPLAVVNPFAPSLTFLSDKTRTRRDHVKYLMLIRTMTLLHQHQRETKTLPDGTRYIEATAADIAAANKLAHEVLGRSLDELPPQTRKLLVLLDALVRERCKKEKRDRSLCLFSRRDVREKTGWGNTQLKIHLARLEDMEYVAVHRASGHRQAWCYELLYDGQGQDGGRFLSGLIEAGELDRSGQNGSRSGCGRPPVGVGSGGGRTAETPASPSGNGHHGALIARNAQPEAAHAMAS